MLFQGHMPWQRGNTSFIFCLTADVLHVFHRGHIHLLARAAAYDLDPFLAFLCFGNGYILQYLVSLRKHVRPASLARQVYRNYRRNLNSCYPRGRRADSVARSIYTTHLYLGHASAHSSRRRVFPSPTASATALYKRRAIARLIMLRAKRALSD